MEFAFLSSEKKKKINKFFYCYNFSLEFFPALIIFNETPFHFACKSKNTELLEYLLSKGANINERTILLEFIGC